MRPTNEIDDPNWGDIHDRDKEIEYWKMVVSYLAQCNSATLESEGTKKSCSKHNKARFRDICQISIDSLQGRFHQRTSDPNVNKQIEHALERCQDALKETK